MNDKQMVELLETIREPRNGFKTEQSIPTASMFESIMAKSARSGKPLKKRSDYMYKLVADRIVGGPANDFVSTKEMKRGTELEPMVIEMYEEFIGYEVERTGFIKTRVRFVWRLS